VCALCNLGEKSTLGQGELIHFTAPEGFNPDDPTKNGNGEDGEGGKSPHSSPAISARKKSYKYVYLSILPD
jgi:hypothetical protein